MPLGYGRFAIHGRISRPISARNTSSPTRTRTSRTSMAFQPNSSPLNTHNGKPAILRFRCWSMSRVVTCFVRPIRPTKTPSTKVSSTPPTGSPAMSIPSPPGRIRSGSTRRSHWSTTAPIPISARLPLIMGRPPTKSANSPVERNSSRTSRPVSRTIHPARRSAAGW